MQVLDKFKQQGGTELAPMSTTRSKAVAFSYAKSKAPLVFQLEAEGLSRGVSIKFLSVYPGEDEYLYSPLAYLLYDSEFIDEDGTKVIRVRPQVA